MRGTLILAVLNIKSSYRADTQELVDKGEVSDTLQWWIGEEGWRIRTFAMDHDIHTYAVGAGKPELIELAQQNNRKHYSDVIAQQHVLEFADCSNAALVAGVLAGVGLPSRLEVAAPRFAFWKPDEARYHTQSAPK